MSSAPAGLVLALVLVGFSVKLALVPAYMWLPAMAQRTPAALVGLVVAVSMSRRSRSSSSFGSGRLGCSRRRGLGWLSPWRPLSAVLYSRSRSMTSSACSRSRPSPARGSWCSVSPSEALSGWLARLPVPAADALSKALLFSAVAGAEREGTQLTLSSRGVARKHPLATAGFLLGALASLGVPFTPGFAGHWRVYATALGAGGHSWPY